MLPSNQHGSVVPSSASRSPTPSRTKRAPASPRPVAAAQITPQPPLDTEVAALRAQLEEMRRAEDRLLQTVLWALGIVALVGIGFLTFNIA